MSALFEQDVSVINLGVSAFADNIASAHGEAVNVDWRPPGEGDVEAAVSLSQLINDPQLDSANQTAFSSYLESRPVLEGLGTALTTVPDMEDRT